MIRGWSVQDNTTSADQVWVTVSNHRGQRGDDQGLARIRTFITVRAAALGLTAREAADRRDLLDRR